MIRREQLEQARNKPSRAPIGCLQHAQLAQVGLERGAPGQMQTEGKKELGLHATAAVPVVFKARPRSPMWQKIFPAWGCVGGP